MGTWDSVDCSMPPVPTQAQTDLNVNAANGANGLMYIVKSVTGDTSTCPDLTIGDWIIWSGDDPGTTPIEGQWSIINWTFDWSAITNVPSNVVNAITQVELDAHANLTDNPHTVTKTQVGLGNADNTSDVNKPISTATQTALDTKPGTTNGGSTETATTIITITQAEYDAIATPDVNTLYFII